MKLELASDPAIDPTIDPAIDRALLDLLYDEDALYDEDVKLAGRDLPPRPWRAAQRAVDEVLGFARLQLDLAWRQLREQARRDRVAAAARGSFEARVAAADRSAVSSSGNAAVTDAP